MIEFSQIPEWVMLGLPVVIVLVWMKTVRSKRHSASESHFSSEYFKGLNYLLNDEQGKALDIFVKLVEADWETIDTHFALGKIFRKNGEIDKAIKIHQGLMSRPSLPEKYRSSVLLELGYDYLGAGWFDRAEGLFKEVLNHDPKSETALQNLIIIYQQEKDWYKAIAAAECLYQENPNKIGLMISQYYCELADIARAKGDLSQLERDAKKALYYDSTSVRASILLADMAMSAGEFKKAKHLLEQIEQQDTEFIPVVMNKIVECHHRLNEAESLLEYLDALEKRQDSLPLLESHAKVLERYKGRDAAIDYVMVKLKKNPTLQGMGQLLSYSDTDNTTEATMIMHGLLTAIDAIQQDQATYQCKQCGFKSNTLYWLCPSCQHWGSVKPYLCEPSC
ncbi:MAG: lipopolysaccharide assembly protein LapB [Gammaproteobacteria bacterium]|nr:lipopolysaccharide assembly protein LapB [Gammaproteobacteria bacterium]